MLKQTYRIEIDNSDDTTSILYAQRPKCKTAKGRDAQHNRMVNQVVEGIRDIRGCLLYTSPSPRDATLSRMPSSA